MLYLANPCGSDAVTATMRAGVLGYIDTPAQGNARPAGVAWCADNGAFSDRFDETKWWQFLVANAHAAADCVFAVAPDVVGDAQATLARSLPWLPRIRALGYPAALVAQNGVDTISDLPWDSFDVLFVGGTVECPDHGPRLDALRTGRGGNQRAHCPVCRREIHDWKLGPEARAVVAAAKSRGKWVHMGRVNSEKRWRYAEAIGSDSVDGTFLTLAPDKNLPRLLRWLRAERSTEALFGALT